MKITIDKNNMKVLLDKNENGIDEFPLGDLLTDFLSLDTDEIAGIINDGTTLTSPRTDAEVERNIDKLYAMADKLTGFHPYFSYINGILLSEKESIDRYGFSIQYDDESIISQSPETEYDDVDHFLLEHDDTFFDSSDIGMMKWLRNLVLKEFVESYDYYTRALDFIFNLDGKSPGSPEQTLKRYYMFKKYNSAPTARVSMENETQVTSSTSLNITEFGSLAKNELQELFDDFAYVDSFYTSHTLSGMLNLELLILSENKAAIKRCKNCDKLFPHLTGYNEYYCKRLDISTGKPCRKIGPQNVSANRKKNDPIVYEFNRAYSRIHKAYKKGTYTEKAYREWLARAKEVREQVRNEEISFENYKRWVSYIEYY